MSHISCNCTVVRLCEYVRVLLDLDVCIYIYSDTKFSYDNNVYFSIFYEHKKSGEKWWKSREKLGKVAKSDEKWRKVDKSG